MTDNEDRAKASASCREHELRCWQPFFDEVATGRKRFEVRKNDRDFRVGDRLRLREFTTDGGYTERSVTKMVSYLLSGGRFGIEDGYVVMGID